MFTLFKRVAVLEGSETWVMEGLERSAQSQIGGWVPEPMDVQKLWPVAPPVLMPFEEEYHHSCLGTSVSNFCPHSAEKCLQNKFGITMRPNIVCAWN